MRPTPNPQGTVVPQSTPTDLKNSTAPSSAVDPSLSAEGYKKTLGRRHVTMIAMGGAIGVGLFMGAGGRLASTGPALIFSYAIAGVIAYLLMRALGELIMYRQTSGSFVSYAGEMFGKKGAFLSGWMYFINWAMTGIAELIAIGLYFQFFFPKGALVMILVLNAVIFAYNAIELVGITAGEMEDPAKEVPKAIRAVVIRIVVFYVGSVTLLAMLLPSDQYKAGESPFVTVFGQMGLPWMGDVMNMIVITAALSSSNSGLYSIGRIFRTMANNGHAPQWLTRMSKSHVPYAALLAIGAVYLVGILLNIWLGGSHAFDLALNTASIGVIFTWGSIFASQIALRKTKGKASSLPMPGSPWTSWAGLVALLAITVLIGFDTMTSKSGEVFQLGLWTLATIPFFAVVLWLGWQKVKNNEPKSELFS